MIGTLIARIIDVDEFGFTGREYHPVREQIGWQVSIKKMESFDATTGQPLSDEALVSTPADELYTCYLCDLAGEPLELMDHEIELVGVLDADGQMLSLVKGGR